MPFIPEETGIVLPDLTQQPDTNVPEIETTLGGAMQRAFRYENILGAFATTKSKGNWIRDEDFNFDEAFKSLPESYQLDKSTSRVFAHAENQEHFDAIKEQIDQEGSDREYNANAGWKGIVANGAAGFLDPINFLPIGGLLYQGAKAGKAISVFSQGARVAMVGAGSISLQEAALHTQQETRTLVESAANISIGTVLSGVLGAGSYALLNKSNKYGDFKKQLEDELDITEHVKADAGIKETPGVSLGAAAAPTKTRDELLKENTLYRGAVFKPVMFQDPSLRLITSPSVVARIAMPELAEFVPKLNKNLKGVPTGKSVEVERGLDEGRLASVILNNQDQFVKYKRRLGKDSTRLSRAEFNIEISKALNRKGKSDIPEVAAAGAKVRDILKHYGKEGLKIKGFFGDGESVTKTLDTYFPRGYNKAAISANPAKFQKKIADYFKGEYAKAKSGDKARIYEDAAEYKDDSYFKGLALDVYDNVMGSSSSVLHDGIGLSSKPSFTKSRKILLDNADLEEFLEMDVDQVITKYSKLMSSRTRMAKKFGAEFLDDDMANSKSSLLKDIKAEYKELKAKVLDDPKALKKLKAREEKDLVDILALRDRLMGTYGYSINPDSWAYRTQRQIKQYNVVNMLGDVLISSLSDIGKLVMADGATKFLTKGLKPLAKSLYSPEFRKYKKLHAREMNRMGVGLDLINNGRVNAIGDIMDDFGKHTKFERAMDVASQKLMTTTGIKHWNGGLKQMASGIIQSNMHDAMSAVAGNKATKKQIANLASSGIDLNSAKAIRAQIKKHGEIIDDLVFPNITKWDAKAKEFGELYASAIKKAADSTIVTPGAGTTPLWMSRNGLTLFGQFQSFAFSSMQKTLIPIVQDFDSKTAQGLITMVGFGTLVAAYKRAARGEEMPDTATLIQEGVDRSGVTSWFMDYNNKLEKLAQGNVGLSRILGTNATNKYHNYNNFSALGPTSGQVTNILSIASDVLSGNADQSTVHSVRRLLPLQTMIGVRQTLDLMEEEFNNNLGIPKN